MSQTYKLEKMDAFFDKRADTYEHHMLVDLQLDEFYEAIDNCFAEAQVASLLDLGCGTGLELERFFRRFPQATVTGIDLSVGMLAQLQAKHPDKTMKLICDSYFDVDLGENSFDCVLSTYSFHHFSVEEKQGLYKKIRKALVPGVFLCWETTPWLRRKGSRSCGRKVSVCARNRVPTVAFTILTRHLQRQRK